LVINVQLDSKMKTDKQKKVKQHINTVSGGERSFSTVSFLLALWSVTDNPFRALDEFDIFMDVQNRGIIIELLIYHARNTPNKQYIFISPQDYSTIKPGPDIMIQKMYPPIRGQQSVVQNDQVDSVE